VARNGDPERVQDRADGVAVHIEDVRDLLERSWVARADTASERTGRQSGRMVESASRNTDDTVRRVAQLEEMVARTHERAAELYETWLERQVTDGPADLQRRAQRHREIAATARSAERLAERTLREFQTRVDTGTPRTGKSRHLLALSALEGLRVLINSRIAGTVGISRREGATWADIAAALGVTRQTAHERYRHDSQ
jgi:hypothetical protein